MFLRTNGVGFSRLRSYPFIASFTFHFFKSLPRSATMPPINWILQWKSAYSCFDKILGIYYAPVNSKTAHPPPPRANPGHLTRVKLCTVGNLTQNEARPVGHLTFVSKRLSAVGNKTPRSRVIALVDSTWVFLLLSFYICISWNMPLFKVWSDDKLKKKFVVAENFAELVSKGKRFCLYSFFMSARRDRMLHATSDLADQYS